MWLSENLLVGCNQYFLTWGRGSKSSEFPSLVRFTLSCWQRTQIWVVRTTLRVRDTFHSFVLLLLKLWCSVFCSPSPRPLWVEENMQWGNLGQETWVAVITTSGLHTVFSIKPSEQLALSCNSCENCFLTSSDYSSDTFKNKLANSVGFRGHFSICRRGVCCGIGESFDRHGPRGSPGWRTSDPRKMS